ncbi:MAG: polymer-forming cytoskeletal protein [Candidatus Theseobacter exili]|nr:polymer-forming cytoskeletal protein [Candidatus Theseobacter exili]
MINLFRKEDGAELQGNDFKQNESKKIKETRKDLIMSDSNVTNLTPDVEIKGSIKFTNVLKIDGKFDGELITDEGDVIVGTTGAIKANVKVKNAIIEGKVDGNVIATEKVELKEKAQLHGDLKARTLVIEEGVVFVGKCNVNPNGFKNETPIIQSENKEDSRNPLLNKNSN